MSQSRPRSQPVPPQPVRLQPAPSPPERVRLAVQKSGRLAESCFDIFQRCGLKMRRSRDSLFARLSGLPIDLLLVRDDDIPGFVAEGVADLGIVGQNVFEEFCLDDEDQGRPVEVALPLGFARCRLSLAAPAGMDISDLTRLQDKRIATTYPAIVTHFLARHGVEAETVMMTGSVEVAPRLAIADVICDIVSTGATLEANGLVEAHTVMESEALLIRNPESLTPGRQQTTDRLIERMIGVQRAASAKYVVMHAPEQALDQVIAVIPGSESPTISQLHNRPGVYSVAAVCREEVFWETIEQLRALGAHDILVLPIEKMLD